jgi:hypothetical protein
MINLDQYDDLVILKMQYSGLRGYHSSQVAIEDTENGGPVSQQVWHIKEPSLLKVLSAKHKSKLQS